MPTTSTSTSTFFYRDRAGSNEKHSSSPTMSTTDTVAHTSHLNPTTPRPSRRTSSVSSLSPTLFPSNVEEKHPTGPSASSSSASFSASQLPPPPPPPSSPPPRYSQHQEQEGAVTYDSHFHSSRALRQGTAKWYDFLKPVEEPVAKPTSFFEGYYGRRSGSSFRRG